MDHVPYEFINNGTRAEEVCKKLMAAKTAGVDTETTGTDPHKDKVTLLSITTKEHGTYVVDTRNENHLKAFAPFFESEDIAKIEHNGSFDYQMIKGTAGVDTENIWCTMLGERTLTAGTQFDGYGLDDVVLKYLGITMDKSVRKSFIGHTGEFTKEQLQYAADDTGLLLPLAGKMKEKMSEENLIKIWKIESQALQAFADIEFYGQLVDPQLWTKSMELNLANAKEAKKNLDKYFENYCGRRFNLGWDGVNPDDQYIIDMDYDSPAVLLRALQQMGVEVDGELIKNTSKDTQKKIQHLPMIKALGAYRSAMKGYGTYGQQYLDAIHPATGRVHFRFNQYGTDTGRPACRGGLNCLNIPRELRYRQCFRSEPGRLISTVDYSGAELRIMADLSGDPGMVKGFNSGVDFHCFVASMLFGVEVTKKNENAHLRTPTKTLNFGLAYGMGPGTLYQRLKGEGVDVTLELCKDLFRRYQSTFQTTVAWLKAQQRYASTNFVMRNRNGRKRAWIAPDRDKAEASILAEFEKKNAKATKKFTPSPLQLKSLINQKIQGQMAAIQREGANFQIQSVNADFTKVAMHRCRKEFKKRNWDARTYNSVYDEIVYDFHESYAKEAFEVQQRIMLESANEMLTQVPMEVEGHLAECWTK